MERKAVRGGRQKITWRRRRVSILKCTDDGSGRHRRWKKRRNMLGSAVKVPPRETKRGEKNAKGAKDSMGALWAWGGTKFWPIIKKRGQMGNSRRSRPKNPGEGGTGGGELENAQ